MITILIFFPFNESQPNEEYRDIYMKKIKIGNGRNLNMDKADKLPKNDIISRSKKS